jgi:hypothetical protein
MEHIDTRQIQFPIRDLDFDAAPAMAVAELQPT